ncbi:hypothetical protein ACFFF5_02800 [Lederbergia wuyishanensis]|uniref:Uncharacterized protein n=1 Tax=Lederbergia wuyishanensis TaxID=1347903 RepID=A0ABU0D0D2_9BACI|nr:hypothetical protein [Lederbergia wuyishanensis]MCJ8006490.1 hypothetical protein [Lederbergia wuyishanensis]MDQ0341866.1 hypothetical protein [Lederbergia wuyishanensis]
MYDPTVFENLKVAIENQVYDLDNIDGIISIVNRVDQMDFAVLARNFSIQFILVDCPDVIAEVALKASLKDLAEEILELPSANPGCSITLKFYKRIDNVSKECEIINQALNSIWENEIEIKQTLSFEYQQEDAGYLNTIEAKFKHKIDEENMNEIEDFLNHVLETIEVLS